MICEGRVRAPNCRLLELTYLVRGAILTCVVSCGPPQRKTMIKVRYTGDTQKDLHTMTSLCALVARDWYNPDIERAETINHMLTAMAMASRLSTGFSAQDPRDFLLLMERPMNTWIPGSSEICFLDATGPTYACLQLLQDRGLN